MQRFSLAVALLIGATSAININSQFVDGQYGDENLNNEIKELKKRQAGDESFLQISASAAAKVGSGVRAKWTELPDCQDYVSWDNGLEFSRSLSGVETTIPLEDDLSNAIIATCKGRYVARNTPIPTVVAGPNTVKAVSRIFDNVWNTATIIPDGEHQIKTIQQGNVNVSEQTQGPMGDFHPAWKYNEDDSPLQPFQDALSSGGQATAVNAWDHEGPGGVNYTVDAMPTNYNNSLQTTFGETLPRNTGTPMTNAAGNVAHVTATGISWGDGTHFTQPAEGIFNSTGHFVGYADEVGLP